LSAASNGSRILRTSTLSIDGTSKLNLNDNDLILDYAGTTPMGDVLSKIVAGRGAAPAGIYSPQATLPAAARHPPASTARRRTARTA
jgi:hypothetical protein